MLEEVAAMAATFLLLTVLVQVATAMTARSAADAAVVAAVRRASLPEADLAEEEARLEAVIAAMVPGAAAVDATLELGPRVIVGRVRFDWVPPGPLLTPIAISLRAEAPLAVAP